MFVYSTANGITRGSYVLCTSLMHFDVCLYRWPKSPLHCPFLGEGFEQMESPGRKLNLLNEGRTADRNKI